MSLRNIGKGTLKVVRLGEEFRAKMNSSGKIWQGSVKIDMTASVSSLLGSALTRRMTILTVCDGEKHISLAFCPASTRPDPGGTRSTLSKTVIRYDSSK